MAAVDDADGDTAPKRDMDSRAAVFVDYEPHHSYGGPVHNPPLKETAALAAAVPPISKVTLCMPPQSLASLSQAQREAVYLALHSMEHFLPDKTTRAGFAIGDSTGVGKGRELAGIMTEMWARGQRRHVWLAPSADLLADATRDVTDLHCPMPVVSLAKLPYGRIDAMPLGVLLEACSNKAVLLAAALRAYGIDDPAAAASPADATVSSLSDGSVPSSDLHASPSVAFDSSAGSLGASDDGAELGGGGVASDSASASSGSSSGTPSGPRLRLRFAGDDVERPFIKYTPVGAPQSIPCPPFTAWSYEAAMSSSGSNDRSAQAAAAAAETRRLMELLPKHLLQSKLPAGFEGCLFINYTQLSCRGKSSSSSSNESFSTSSSSGGSGTTRLSMIKAWAGGLGFNGVIAFDECHKAKNLM